MAMPNVPEGFEEHVKGSATADSPDEPAVTYYTDGTVGILKTARQRIGDPDHVKVFYKGTSAAIVPTGPDADNGYKLYNGCISAGWLENELGVEISPGRYRAQDANGMLVVDFAEGPIDSE